MKKTYLITAGPTREYLDPVRYISNASSGKMGYSLAAEAGKRGNRVILITGPTKIPSPENAKIISVTTALEMKQQVLEHVKEADVVIASAAVVDYRTENISEKKLKSSAKTMSVKLKKNPDILKELGRNKKGKILVGFALETDNLVDNAIKKIEEKNLDMIIANNPNSIEGDRSKAVIIKRGDNPVELPEMDKESLAGRIISEIEKL